MNLIVCMKQTEYPTLRPDRSAVEAAIRLKRQTNAFIKIFYIGKSNAMTLIREALAMGCDEGALICTDHLAEPDAAACAQLLSAAINEYCKSSQKTFDVIFTGCYAADADAIQMGLLLAGSLALPHASFVSDAAPERSNEGSALIVKRQMEDRLQIFSLKPPCLISALPLPNKPIYPTADGISRAYASDISVWKARELALQLPVSRAEDRSVLQKVKHYKKELRKKGTVLTVSTEQGVEAILAKIREHHLL